MAEKHGALWRIAPINSRKRDRSASSSPGSRTSQLNELLRDEPLAKLVVQCVGINLIALMPLSPQIHVTSWIFKLLTDAGVIAMRLDDDLKVVIGAFTLLSLYSSTFPPLPPAG